MVLHSIERDLLPAQYQERAEQVTKSSETIARMQSYVGTMESERARAVHTAQYLARDVAALHDQMEHQQPAKLATLSTTLSEMASHGADLAGGRTAESPRARPCHRPEEP